MILEIELVVLLVILPELMDVDQLGTRPSGNS